MRKSLLFFAAASLLLAGCAKEQLVEEKISNGVVTEVSATFENLVPDGATKASVAINGETGNFSWQNDDAAAFILDGGTSYGTGTYNSTTGMFTITGSAVQHKPAVFPEDLVTSLTPTSDKVGSVKVPASREWAANQTNVAMYGTYTSDKYTFKHLGGLVKVTVVNVPTTAKTFVFKTADKKINGTFTVETDDESNEVIKTGTPETGEDTYTLNLPSTITANSTMDFYVPLPVGTGYKFAFYLKDDSSHDLVKIEGTTAQTVARKSILVMPTITLAAASIEDIYKSATIQEVPAGHSGDFLLAKSEKVVLKVNTSTVDKDITLKYNGVNLPTNLKIEVVGEGFFNAKISGDLPYTHVDFTEGEIKEVDIITSGSTFNIIHPAKISDKLTVRGGNVVLEGAKVGAIEVAANAKANPTTGEGTVKITMNTATVESQEIKPEVVGTIVANANIEVAPAQGVEVFVAPAQGVQVTKEGDAEGKVVEVGDKPVMIGSTGYDDLAAAINVVTEDQTIKVLKNISNANGISVAKDANKNFTVDFGGHTYTCFDNPAGSTGTTNQVFQLNEGNTITFKNGTINVAETNKAKFRFIIQNYANLTLEDMTLDGTGLSYNTDSKGYTYALSNNCGLVELKGKTSIIASTESELNNYAFDVCKYASYDAPTVTWNSTGSVDGEIELTGGEFILGHNLEVNQPVRVKAAATLNLGTYTLSGSSDFSKKGRGVVIVNRDGDLTIKGTTGIIDGATNEINAAVVLTEPEACDINTENLGKSAKLTVEGGTLKGYYYGISGNGNSNRHNTVITIKGGTIQGYKSDDCVGIYHPQGGELIISGGEIKGSTGLVLKGGNLTITGGEIKGIGTADSFVHNGSGWHNTGDALAVEVCDYPGQPLTVNINGGVFTSTNGNAVASYVQPDKGYEALTGFIHGGTFTDESAIKYAANGADINIALQANRNASGIFLGASKNVKVTFDLGSNTLNFVAPAVGSNGTENQAFHIEQGNQLFTLKNGKVTIDESAKTAFRFIIQNYNDLTVDGVELDGTNLGYPDKVRYTVSNNQGTVNFTGATSIKAASEKDVAFDVCKYSNYAAPTVTWNSTGTVTGGIELSGGEFILGHNLEVKHPIKVIAPATLDLKTYTLSGSSDFIKQKRGVVIVNRGGELTINGTTGTIDGATNKVYSAVTMTEMEETGDNVAKLTVNGGTLKGYYYGISGNGSRHNTEINIKGGNILGTCAAPEGNVGIFHPQDGTLNITGGTIEGYSSAVEVRAGTVSISGGSLKSTATTYKCEANDSGNTTDGAALAIAQHNTKKDINVTISGGEFTGLRTVNVENPQNNDGNNVTVSISGGKYEATDFAVVNNDARTTVSISDGEFKATNTASGRGIAVYARLGSVNITGGEFTNNSNSEATLHVGCPDAVTAQLQPKLTISGEDTVVKNTASGTYTHNASMSPLTVNMANELTHKAVEISGGTFHGQSPEKDDSWTSVSDAHKYFLATGYAVSGDETNGWTVVSANQN